jgi:AcrR family transcriptional regulator
VSPGTVYLYVADKDALLELAFLRACGSPEVAFPDLPFRGRGRVGLGAAAARAVGAAVHFPQLWVAAQRQEVTGPGAEYQAILLEIGQWMARHRAALLMAHRSRAERPELAAAFEPVWSELGDRLARHLGSRAEAGHLALPGEPAVLARVALDAVGGVVLGTAALPAQGHGEVPLDMVCALLVPRSAQGAGPQTGPSRASTPA